MHQCSRTAQNTNKRKSHPLVCIWYKGTLMSCFDMSTDLLTALTFKGSTFPAPFMSNTGVVLVGLTRGLQTFATSTVFIALFAGMPLVSTGLHISVWHHIASTINPRGWLMLAFITRKSSLVPLLEGLCSSNPCRFEISVFWVFAGSEPTTSGLTVPRSDQLS